jgi:hypothetical protein
VYPQRLTKYRKGKAAAIQYLDGVDTLRKGYCTGAVTFTIAIM